MKKLLSKILCVLLSLFLITSFVACGGSDDNRDNPSDGDNSSTIIDPDRPVDKTKAQLKISNFNGGFGTEWLYRAIARFEEEFKDEEFLDGKVGVQVSVEPNKGLSGDIRGEEYEIYFVENYNYYDGVTSGKLYDISEWVTTPLTEFNENRSIADKMSSLYDNYFKTPNGKYYGVPHYQRMNSITYDRDLFDEKTLFIDSEGNFTKTHSDSGLSTGADGKAGTWDDGLPATYAQFYALCETMQKRGVDPIIWSGGIDFYSTMELAALKADFEGSESSLFYDFNGTATKLVNSVTNGEITYKAPTTITEGNGYELYNSAGFYYALDFLHTLVSKNYANSGVYNESLSHTGAQDTFLLSKYNSNSNPIGMLMEGNWWIHEAKATFQKMEKRYSNASMQKRNLALMPYPKATTELVGSNNTILDNGGSVAFVNGNISEDKVDLIRTFFRYLHTNQSLVEFVLTTSTTRGFDFTMSDEEYNSLPTFGKSLFDLINSGTTVIPFSSSPFFYKNYSGFTYLQQFATGNYTHPVAAFREGKTTLEVFNGIRNKYSATTWGALTEI